MREYLTHRDNAGVPGKNVSELRLHHRPGKTPRAITAAEDAGRGIRRT